MEIIVISDYLLTNLTLELRHQIYIGKINVLEIESDIESISVK